MNGRPRLELFVNSKFDGEISNDNSSDRETVTVRIPAVRFRFYFIQFDFIQKPATHGQPSH